MDGRYVGVFDSGVGGVSVLRELARVLPGERYLYCGDTKNAPYGDREKDEILALTRESVAKMTPFGLKALVVACNTATSAAASALRAEMDIPVIGMEPALKPAALERKSGKILVMATAATIRQEKYRQLMEKYGRYAINCPCPGLMEFAERGEIDSPELDKYLSDRFSEFAGEEIESAVLGCTHYVFLKDAIRRALKGAKLYDGNEGTAHRLKDVLAQKDALNPGPGKVKFMASDAGALAIMERLFLSK